MSAPYCCKNNIVYFENNNVLFIKKLYML